MSLTPMQSMAVGIEKNDLFDSMQSYNIGLLNELEVSGGNSVIFGNTRSSIDGNIHSAIDSFTVNAHDNNSQHINAASLFDWCNQSLILMYDMNNCATGNSSNITMTDDDISFILPWWRQVLWTILFGVMVIVATGGNLIVIWVVFTTKRMRTVTNYFIVNLSIADAMVSSLNVTFNYVYMLDNDWPFGEVYCKISQFIATLSISASVFTLMAISIDRYIAIMKPLEPRMSKECNLGIAALIWAASTAISSPMLLFFTTGEVQLKEGTRIVCYTEWPDGPTNHSQLEYVYNIVFMLFTYILPIILMTATYSRVGIKLWGSKAIGEYTPRQVENVRSKRRVVKMMMVVVLIFAVCWLPFHIYFIITSYYPDLTQTPFIQEVYLGIYWLAMSNSMYNPIIYCWMNSRFRFGFKLFFRWCPFVHLGAESLNRRDNMTSRYSCTGSPDHNRIKRNDTQRSFLYACPSSPKTRRVSSHHGVFRNPTMVSSQRDVMRHSAPIGTNTNTNAYHQRFSISNCSNSHELTSLTSLNGTSNIGPYGGLLMKGEPTIKVPMRNSSTQPAVVPSGHLWTANAMDTNNITNDLTAILSTTTIFTTTTTTTTTTSLAGSCVRDVTNVNTTS